MRAVRGEPLSLLVPDVDEFKSSNVRFGHPAGDRVLVVVAAAVRSTLRTPTDLPARYGGEGFVVLLPHTGLADASRVEARIRHAVGALAVSHDRAARGTLSMSVGVASARPDDRRADHSRLPTEADAALHAAKPAGRNRVECA
ncbi:diguanylate cyclase [Pseudonocardia alni]|uniref:diguanylate cyclase n=1 Tax=Pseudonocardia alni TaxID=33907 RepID=UPI0028A9594D|nr:diguanylate cyclase [Pseudonocardia antarctica]